MEKRKRRTKEGKFYTAAWTGLLLSLVLITCCLSPCGEVYAASSSMSSASGTPGSTVNLVLTINADGATGMQCDISCDSSVVTINSVSAANGWSVLTTYPSTFSSIDWNSIPISGNVALVSIAVHISESASPGAKASVTASGIICSDKDGNYVYQGSTSGTVTVTAPATTAAPQTAAPTAAAPVETAPAETAPPETTAYVPSSVADLAEISAPDATITPSFSPDVTEYDIVYEPFVTEPAFTWTLADDRAQAQMEGELPEPSQKSDVSVIVTAEDGTTKTYLFHFSYSDRELTPLEILGIDEEEASDRLAAGDDEEILQVLIENGYILIEIEQETEILKAAEGAERSAFALLSTDNQLKILNGEKMVLTLSVNRLTWQDFPEESADGEDFDELTKMLLQGAEQNYAIEQILRISASFQIGEAGSKDVVAFPVPMPLELNREEPTDEMLRLIERAGLESGDSFFLLDFTWSESGQAEIALKQTGDLILLTEAAEPEPEPEAEPETEEPETEEAQETSSLSARVVSSFIIGALIGAAAAVLIFAIRRRRIDKEEEAAEDSDAGEVKEDEEDQDR